MTDKYNERFTPENIDEQLDQYLATHAPQSSERPAIRAAKALQAYYAPSQDSDQPLQRVWNRFVQQRASLSTGQRNGLHSHLSAQHIQHIRRYPMSNTSVDSRNKHMFSRRLGMIAAVVFMTLLVGSMLVVFNAARLHKMGTGVGSTLTGSGGPSGKPIQVIYHSGAYYELYDLVWSPDGKRIAEAFYNKNSGYTIQSWDATSGKNVLTYAIPSSTSIVTGIAWSPDGKSLAATIATPSSNPPQDTFQVFDAKTAALKTSLPVPATNTLSSAASTGPVGLQSTAGKSLLSSTVSLSGVGPKLHSPSWSPDSQFLAAACVCSSPNQMLAVWNVTTGEMVKSINVGGNNMVQTQWAPHGRFLAIDVTMQSQREVQIWDTTTWSMVQQYPHAEDFSWSPDGQQIAFTLGGRGIHIVSAASGKTVKQIGLRDQNDQNITDIGWSPDGSRIAIVDITSFKVVQFWSPVSGKLLSTATGVNYYQSGPLQIVWAPDSRYIASSLSASSPPSSREEAVVWVAK